MAAFRKTAPCSLVKIQWRHRGAYCLHYQGDWLVAVMMEAVRTSARASTSTRLHGAVSQKAGMLTLTAMRAWNLTYWVLCSDSTAHALCCFIVMGMRHLSASSVLHTVTCTASLLFPPLSVFSDSANSGTSILWYSGLWLCSDSTAHALCCFIVMGMRHLSASSVLHTVTCAASLLFPPLSVFSDSANSGTSILWYSGLWLCSDSTAHALCYFIVMGMRHFVRFLRASYSNLHSFTAISSFVCILR
jgi:hypothetical protein